MHIIKYKNEYFITRGVLENKDYAFAYDLYTYFNLFKENIRVNYFINLKGQKYKLIHLKGNYETLTQKL